MSTTILQCGPFSVRSRKALARRQVAKRNKLHVDSASYRFVGLDEQLLSINENQAELESDDELNSLSCKNCPALFFDQTDYMFSIKLPKDTVTAQLFSPIATWCDRADWDVDSKKLSIPVNFGNDLGDFELCWEWKTADGERHSALFSSQVYSTKLDIFQDFGVMISEVTDRFEWIQLDLLRQTTWGWSHDSGAESTLKTWLLIFQDVRRGMEERFRKLLERHRRHLVSETKMLRVEQIRKISPRLEESVYEGIQTNLRRRYPVGKKVLDADTPENRYMKHILFQTINQLNEVIDKIRPVKRISDVFKERLAEWSNSFGILKQHRFWRGIGDFHGLRHESLILSQDPLYAGVRRAWFLLQQGLTFLDHDLRGGIQNAAQLYEVWCLVKLDQLVVETGWEPVGNRVVDFERAGDDFDIDSEELRSGTVKFTYRKAGVDDIEVSLLFQPTAGAVPANSDVWEGMTAVPVTQKPDIVLRLHRNDLPGQPIYTWIFDAKYRLNGNNAPDDAINQMHRYRDAILWSSEIAGGRKLTRESIGAYVLYPGLDSELSEQSKQISSIAKTNIGAYPLRPAQEEICHRLLKNRLESFLAVQQDYPSVQEAQVRYFSAVPAVKVTMNSVFAKCVTSSGDKMNTAKYWENCRYYRLPDRVVQKNDLEPKLWTYLIPTSRGGDQLGNFPVLSVVKMKRKDIKRLYDDQGTVMHNNRKRADEYYWLFTLGEPLDDMPALGSLGSKKVVLVQDA